MPIGGPSVAVTSTSVGGNEVDFLVKVTNVAPADVVNLSGVVAVNVGLLAATGTGTVVAIAPPPPPPPTPVTLSPSTSLVLSLDGVTVTCAVAGKFVAKTTVAKSAGSWLVGIKDLTTGPDFAFGLVNANFPNNQFYLGSDANGIGFYPSDAVTPGAFWLKNNIIPAIGQPGRPPQAGAAKGASGDLYLMAWDADAKLLRVKTPQMVSLLGPNTWNWQANAWNPVTGTFTAASGLDVSSLGSELWPAIGLADTGTSGSLVLTGLPAMAGYAVLAGPST